MEETISLQEIFGVIKKRFAMIISMVFLGIGLAALVTFFVITPKYSSSAQLLAKMAQTENNTVNVGDVNANLMLINTYKDVIKSSVVIDDSLGKLQKSVDFEGDADDLREMLAVDQAQNSQMFTITAKSTSAEEAQIVANTVASVFQKQAKEVIDLDKVSIIAEAPINEKPVSPNAKLFILAGAILGMALGFGLALLSEVLDKTVKDPKFISDNLGFPVLGTVPEMTAKELTAKVDLSSVENKEKETKMESDSSRRSRRGRNRV